jgi:hypothetical protein
MLHALHTLLQICTMQHYVSHKYSNHNELARMSRRKAGVSVARWTAQLTDLVKQHDTGWFCRLPARQTKPVLPAVELILLLLLLHCQYSNMMNGPMHVNYLVNTFTGRCRAEKSLLNCHVGLQSLLNCHVRPQISTVHSKYQHHT